MMMMMMMMLMMMMMTIRMMMMMITTIKSADVEMMIYLSKYQYAHPRPNQLIFTHPLGMYV